MGPRPAGGLHHPVPGQVPAAARLATPHHPGQQMLADRLGCTAGCVHHRLRGAPQLLGHQTRPVTRPHDLAVVRPQTGVARRAQEQAEGGGRPRLAADPVHTLGVPPLGDGGDRLAADDSLIGGPDQRRGSRVRLVVQVAECRGLLRHPLLGLLPRDALHPGAHHGDLVLAHRRLDGGRSTPLGVNRSISPLLEVASRMPRSMNRPLYARKSSIIRFNRSWCQAPPHHEMTRSRLALPLVRLRPGRRRWRSWVAT